MSATTTTDKGSTNGSSGAIYGADDGGDRRPTKLSRAQIAARAGIILAILFIVMMWIYAFVLADDRPLADLDDNGWASRAEQICEVRDNLLDQNAANATAVADGSPQKLGQAVRVATDIIEDTLDEVLAVRPTSARDVRLVDEWETLYRVYIDDRRDVETRLLAGEAVELNETTVNGSPVSLTIGDFAKHNRMETCSVPAGR
jgi:hypothetical protein